MISDESDNEDELARLIELMRAGDRPNWNLLSERVYDRLKRSASRIAGFSGNPSMGATALISETFVKLAKNQSYEHIKDVKHFFASFTFMMKQVYTDHFRHKNTWKNGGRMKRIEMDIAVSYFVSETGSLEDLNEALDLLAQGHQRQATALEMQVFLAMTVPEIVAVVEHEKSTVESDLRFAKAFIRRHLQISS